MRVTIIPEIRKCRIEDVSALDVSRSRCQQCPGAGFVGLLSQLQQRARLAEAGAGLAELACSVRQGML